MSSAAVRDFETIAPLLDPWHRRVAEEAEEFARSVLLPLPAPEDDAAARDQARQVLTLLGEAGWCRESVPADYGGARERVDTRACCLIRQAVAWASPLADAVFALQCLGAMPLALGGDERVRRRYLPAVAEGRAMAAFALTEPEAGSDAASMTTRARRDGDGWVLEGEKHLISNAGIADFYVVFAVTDPEARSRGITAFVVDADRPGVVFRGAQVLSEPHPLGRIGFEGVRLAAAARVGTEGGGLKLALATLDRLRPTVAAAACGMGLRARDVALEWTRSRRQFGRPLSELQIVRSKLAELATELEAARLLTFRAAREADLEGPRLTVLASMAKAYATEAAWRAVDQAVQLSGGRGVLADHPADRLYRAVRALRIYEGATEIQHLVIARHLLAEAE